MTKPSDIKPSEWITNFEQNEGCSKVDAAIAYLDEQHAAGHRESEPVLAPDEAAWADYRARSAPVAEPPAQPVAAAPAYRVDIALLRQAAERCRDAKPDGHELLDALRHLQGCFGWQTVLGLLAQLGAAESKLDAIEGAACVAAEPAVLVAGEAPTGAALLWKMFGNRMGDERYCHMLDGAEARSIVDERAKLAHERYEALLQVEKLTKDKESLWKELEGSLKQTLDQKLKHAGEIGEVRAALTASNERAERLESANAELAGELMNIRDICGSEGCVEPPLDCANRTLCMVEELRQRGACNARDCHEPPPVATGERELLEIGDKVQADWMGPGITGEVICVNPGDDIGVKVRFLKPQPYESWSDRKSLRLLATDPPTPATGGEGEA